MRIVTPDVTPKLSCRPLSRRIGRNSLILLVPVERIELPTFGLQNRCSTAELNRHLIENPLYRFCPLQPVADGTGAPSNIRVGWQGLLVRKLAPDAEREPFPGACRSAPVPPPGLQPILNHHGLFSGPWGSGLNMLKRRCERFGGANRCLRLGWTPLIGLTVRAARLSGSGTQRSSAGL